MGLFTPGYLKEGKGVRKDEPPKKGIARFIEIFARDFGDLVKLNLLFIISCIPLITIGPAIVALSAVMVKRIRNKPCYVFHEYKLAFKENFKRSLPAGLIVTLLLSMSGFAVWYYGSTYNANDNIVFLALTSVTVLLTVLISTGSCYLYTMIALIDLPLKQQFRNAVLLTFGFLPRTALFFVICLVLWALMINFIVFTFLLFIIIFFSIVNLIINMNVWPVLEKVFVTGMDNKEDEELENNDAD